MNQPEEPLVGALSESTLSTYRYLRVAVVGLSVLLGVSLFIEVAWGETEGLGSISAYYYSPVQSIFVGALVAIGLALIAIKGRPGLDDLMLNLAGMLAPLVAFVPTPLPSAEAHCAGEAKRCVPEKFVPSIENNVTALIVVGAVGIIAAWFMASASGTARYGMWVAVVVWLGFTLWFMFGRTSFFVGAHYGSAVPFFGLIGGVAWLHARQQRAQAPVPGLPFIRYRSSYKTIAGAMGLTIAAAGGLFALDTWTDLSLYHAWIFVVEAVLLGLFVAFWVFQTVDYWEDGVPDPGAE